VLIRLSHPPTTDSILSICMNVGRSWQSTYLSGTICRSLTRFLSFSACSRMKRRVLPTLSAHDGALGSSVRTVGWLTGHGTFLRALGCFAAAIAAATQPYRRHRHGAHAYAALGRVLGSLRGRQPDARPVGHLVARLWAATIARSRKSSGAIWRQIRTTNLKRLRL